VTARAHAPILLLPFALGCASTSPGEAKPPAVELPSASGAAPAKPADPAIANLQNNLEHAQDEAATAGWRVTKVTEIPGHHAAIVTYHPDRQHAMAYKTARVDAVSGGAYRVISNQSGMIDLMRTPSGALTWDLRGDGKSSVVINLTPCGANCGVAKSMVLELDGDHFFVPPSTPACPTCMKDDDRNGVPEFERGLVRLVVAPCSRASCGPSAELMVEVRGLETWDGQKYADDLAELRPLYFERLKRARHEADTVQRESQKSKICPVGAIQAAADLFVYSRFIGESRGDALRLAARVMKGYDTTPCSTEYDLLASPKPWSDLVAELGHVELPPLERAATRTRR
jgi:hypothetical protein